MSDSEDADESEKSGDGAGSSSSSSASELRKRDHQGTPKPNATDSLLDIALQIHDRLCVDEHQSLAVKAHKSAVNRMVKMRNELMKLQGDPGRDTRLLLLYSGIAIHRRMNLGAEGIEAEDFMVTMALLFMLQVMCDSSARDAASSHHSSPLPMETGMGGPSRQTPMSPSLMQNEPPPIAGDASKPNEEETNDPVAPPTPDRSKDEEMLERWASVTLWERMMETQMDDSEWAAVLRPSPESTCRACVVQASRLGEAGSLARVTALACTFFRCSTLSLQYNMLCACEPGVSADESFLTLGSLDFMVAVNDDMQQQKLSAIVDAGESEAGQQCLRDLILSFTLPQSVVGVRRTPLLGREANRIATEQYTTELGNAHEAAMRGAEWSWKEDKEEVHKMCALLSGLCILFAGRGGSADIIRKNDAFMGRVQLPFLETAMPAPGLKMLGFIPHRNEWLVYTVNRKKKVDVLLKHDGFDGLCQAALLVTSDLKR